MAEGLRFKVGDRVTCARGICIGATGHVARRAPATAANGQPGADWVVRLDKPASFGSHEVWFDDDEIEPWTVPESARPMSVDALQHPMRTEARRG